MAADPSGESLDEVAGAIEQPYIVGNKVDAARCDCWAVMTPRVGPRSPGTAPPPTGWPPPPGSPRRPRGGGYTRPALRDDLPGDGYGVGRGADQSGTCAGHRGARRVLGEDYAGIEATVAGSQPSTPPRIYAPSWK